MAQSSPSAIPEPSATTTSTPQTHPDPTSLPLRTSTSEAKAAQTIQRNYRGYRSRRQLDGRGLDSSTRWMDAIKEAQYRNLIRPRPRSEHSGTPLREDTVSPFGPGSPTSPSFAQAEWKRVKQITRRAHKDDTSESEGEDGMSPERLVQYRQKKADAKREREKNARGMGLSYWLEMVDEKRTADTHENFFYWLDEGEGRNIDAPTCSREVLDRDQVRYLSREERQDYLVKVDKQGHFRWAKNNELVDTNYNYKDSLKGIVKVDDTTPAYREDTRYPNKHPPPQAGATIHVSSDDSGEDSATDGAHYVNSDLHNAKGVQKVQYVSAAAVLNHLLKSTTKKNTWIFVVDTSFRLYIGIKQSGAFQHSSFLQGSRISAAGLIRVKHGQLRSMSPLSGHYRPPTSAFRAFVHALKEEGVDMSRVNIGKSYAVLLGLEGYLATKERAKSGMGELERHFEKLMDPQQARKRQEEAEDKSESARKEKEHMERAKAEKKGQGLRTSLRKTFSLHSQTSDGTPEPGKKAA